jgi:uncharacterized protein YoxC
MLLEISIFILSVAFLLFALFSIPTLLQLRRTAERVADTAQTLNQNLPAILRNLEGMTTHLNQATLTVHHQIDGIAYQAKKLQLTLGYFAEVARILQGSAKSPVIGTLATLTAGVKGVRAFLNVLGNDRLTR